MLILTPNSSKTSAAPHLLEAERFPCFATGPPAADITNDEVVDILNVFEPLPPVPTISNTYKSFKSRVQWDLIA